jgi:hypothetical protein
METVAIGLICTVVFGLVMTLSAFIRQLLLSRDKKLNDLALQRALLQESNELSNLRGQMEKNNNRFGLHNQALDANKEWIKYIDQKIDAIFTKKTELIQRYAQMALKESSAIIEGGQSTERKNMCDVLKGEIDRELQSYDTELQHLQAQRSSIWGAHHELLNTLMANEQFRNVNLDNLYERHTGILNEIYLRHDQSSADFSDETLTAGTQFFSDVLKAPIQFLAHYFKLSSNISPDKMEDEIRARQRVKNTEDEINDTDSIKAGKKSKESSQTP